MSDFGLNDAIEAGLVKTPRVVIRDDGRLTADYNRRELINKQKFGDKEVQIPTDKEDTMAKHVSNFLSRVRSRQQPTLDVETAACAQIPITMAVQSYRQGKVVYFDQKAFRIVDRPPML